VFDGSDGLPMLAGGDPGGGVGGRGRGSGGIGQPRIAFGGLDL